MPSSAKSTRRRPAPKAPAGAAGREILNQAAADAEAEARRIVRDAARTITATTAVLRAALEHASSLLPVEDAAFEDMLDDRAPFTFAGVLRRLSAAFADDDSRKLASIADAIERDARTTDDRERRDWEVACRRRARKRAQEARDLAAMYRTGEAHRWAP